MTTQATRMRDTAAGLTEVGVAGAGVAGGPAPTAGRLRAVGGLRAAAAGAAQTRATGACAEVASGLPGAVGPAPATGSPCAGTVGAEAAGLLATPDGASSARGLRG